MFRNPFNDSLDTFVRPEITLLHRPRPAFQVCGYSGLALAIFLSLGLVIYQGLSAWVMLAIILAAVLTFFAQAFLTKIVTDKENLVYYRHEIAVMAAAALLLWLLHQPAMHYLDATLLGVGLFLACGRIGCLMVGCCHGRPARWGVCYRKEHAAAGFTACYVGVRLFPSQLLESLWVFVLVLVGSLFVLRHHPAGTALAWYVVAYDVGRFHFEFLRGDAERPYFGGFSEAQWVSVLLIVVVVGAEAAGVLPFVLWHLLASGAVASVMLAVAACRCWRPVPIHRLAHPAHLKELAEILSQVTSETGPRIHVVRTSLGIQLSASEIQSETGDIWLYGLSHQESNLSEQEARKVARLILNLRHPLSPGKLIRGNQGLFHLLVPIAQKTGGRAYLSPLHTCTDSSAQVMI